MSMLLANSFDYMTDTDSTNYHFGWGPIDSNYCDAHISGGRWGGPYIRIWKAGYGGYLSPEFTAGSSTIYCKFDVLPVIGSDSDGATLTIRTSSTTSSTWIWGEFHVQIYFTGQIKVFRGGYVSGSSTLIATSTERAVSFNHWHTMEVMVTLATDATGAYEIKVDGQTVMSGTNVQTCVTASTVPNRILLGPGKNAAFYSHVAVNDDTGSYNNTWVGDAYIESLFPTSDTSVAFTPLSGTVNYAMVDDVTPDANTSYVYATATGLTDQYSYGNLSYVSSVDAVVHNIEAANLGTDTTPDIHTFIVSGTTTATSATHTMNSAYNRWLADIHDTDPNTGAAWNGTDVDALEGGVESL